MTDATVTYDTLRHLADSWGLVLMVIAFSACALWPFRPGSRSSNETAAMMIFKEDDNG